MIIAAIIIGIILIFFVFLATDINNKEDSKFGNGLTLGVVITMLSFIEALLIGCIFTDPYPTAMDVYQGKTTLKITYIDSISIDTVVVFKEEFRK